MTSDPKPEDTPIEAAGEAVVHAGEQAAEAGVALVEPAAEATADGAEAAREAVEDAAGAVRMPNGAPEALRRTTFAAFAYPVDAGERLVALTDAIGATWAERARRLGAVEVEHRRRLADCETPTEMLRALSQWTVARLDVVADGHQQIGRALIEHLAPPRTGSADGDAHR
jgi:hypothetical protein